MKTKAALKDRVDVIFGAVARAEASRLLVDWRSGDIDHARVLEAMRRAVERTDGGLNITTDALEAAWVAALREAKRALR